MARIPNLNSINDQRIRVINIGRENEDSLILTLEETQVFLKGFIETELGYYTDEVSRKRKTEVEERLNLRLIQLQEDILAHVNYKINKITERIVEATITRVVEEEVDKRVKEKLKKLNGINKNKLG